MDLRGKVCVVTGASRGIGEAAARAFAAEGCDVALAARSREALESLAKDLEGRHRVRTLAQPTDVRDWAQVQALAQAVQQKLGRCDVLVNNAGVGIGGTLADMQVAHLDETLEVNLRGPMLVAKAFLPLLKRDATVLNIASVAAANPPAGLGAYSASKAGLRAFSQALGQELAPKGVRVVCVNPGYVATEMVDDAPMPMAKMVQPADLARLFVRLATQPPSAYVDELTVWPRELYNDEG